MACPDAWLTLQPLIKIVFVSTVSGFCSVILGFATPVWISASINMHFFNIDGKHSGTGSVDHLGLWQACGGSVSGCLNVNRDLPAYFVATRVFACFSLISAFVATSLVFWYTCVSKGESGRILIFSMISSFVTGGLLTVTLGIFGGKVQTHLSFSFAMMCIADIIYVVNGVLFLVYLGTGRR